MINRFWKHYIGHFTFCVQLDVRRNGLKMIFKLSLKSIGQQIELKRINFSNPLLTLSLKLN